MKKYKTEDDIDKEMDNIEVVQIRRKSSLRKIIDIYCDGNVNKFSELTGKHPAYVYGMLRSIDEKNQIKISTKMARHIEQIFGLSRLEMDVNNSAETLNQHKIFTQTVSQHVDLEMKNTVNQLIPYMYTKSQYMMDSPYDGLDVNKDLYIDFRAQRHLIQGEIFHTKIIDDSMSPRLNKGGYAIFQYYDPIVYPTKERKFIMDILEDGAIFLIKYKSVAKFYRVIYRVYVDEIELRCDNKSCEDEFNEVIYSEEEFCCSGMNIVGKVVGYIEIDGDFR